MVLVMSKTVCVVCVCVVWSVRLSDLPSRCELKHVLSSTGGSSGCSMAIKVEIERLCFGLDVQEVDTHFFESEHELVVTEQRFGSVNERPVSTEGSLAGSRCEIGGEASGVFDFVCDTDTRKDGLNTGGLVVLVSNQLESSVCVEDREVVFLCTSRRDSHGLHSPTVRRNGHIDAFTDGAFDYHHVTHSDRTGED